MSVDRGYVAKRLREHLRAALANAERVELLADELGDANLSVAARHASALWLNALLGYVERGDKPPDNTAKRGRKGTRQ